MWMLEKTRAWVLTCVRQSVNTSRHCFFCILHVSQSVSPPSSGTPPSTWTLILRNLPKFLLIATVMALALQLAVRTPLQLCGHQQDGGKLGVGGDLFHLFPSFLLCDPQVFVSCPHWGNEKQVVGCRTFWKWQNFKGWEQARGHSGVGRRGWVW